MRECPSSSLKSVLAGALAGAFVFGVLSAARAQLSLTVDDVRHEPKRYVGTQVQVTGIAKYVRTAAKTVSGRKVPYVKLSLYGTDAKGRPGDHYIYVFLPES